MHSEIIESGKDSRLSVMLMSFGLVVILILIVGLSNFAYNRYGISYSGYIAFLLYIVIGIYIYRKKIIKYQYTYNDNQIILESLAGKRSREIIRVNLDRTLYFCPLSYERTDKNTKYKNHYIMFSRHSLKAWVLAFKENGKVHRIVFEPSDKLVELIKNP